MELKEALEKIAGVLTEASAGYLAEAPMFSEENQVSKTIYDQIRTLDKKAFMAWGAKDFVNMNDGLKFKTTGMVKWKGQVYIKYNKGTDLYDIQFFRIVKMDIKTDKEVKGVQVENLVKTIDAQVG